MRDEKIGKKPNDEGGLGIEMPNAAEVAGRERQLMYYCFNCGAGNYVEPSWKWFTCWRCGPTLNYIN